MNQGGGGSGSASASPTNKKTIDLSGASDNDSGSSSKFMSVNSDSLADLCTAKRASWFFSSGK